MFLELRTFLLFFLLTLASKLTLLLGARSGVGSRRQSLGSGIGRREEKADHE